MLELALHILDIAENSVRAGAKTVFIDIAEDRTKDRLSIEIRDDGAGMDEATVKKAMDPFTPPKRFGGSAWGCRCLQRQRRGPAEVLRSNRARGWGHGLRWNSGSATSTGSRWAI